MQIKLPIPRGASIETPESGPDAVQVHEQSVTVTDVDDTVATQARGGLLYGVYDLLTTQGVLSETAVSKLEATVGDWLCARLEYEDVDGQWTVVTNPSFRPREPADASNSPLAKADVVPLDETGFARFLGWRGDDGTPTFAVRMAGTPASRRGRLRLDDADSLFGTERETTVKQVLL
jgi:hypothetical protein